MVEKLEGFKKILELIVSIFEFMLKNIKIFLIIFVIFIIYLISRYYYYCTPKEIISTFYTSLNEQNYDNAWGLISEKYRQEKFKNDQNTFRVGYATTKGLEEINIEDNESSYNPLKFLFNKEIIFKTRYVVEDKIKKQDLTNKGVQAVNSFWVEVQEEKSIELLKKSTDNKFVIRRVFNQNIRLIKENGNWKIVKIKINQIGLEVK